MGGEDEEEEGKGEGRTWVSICQNFEIVSSPLRSCMEDLNFNFCIVLFNPPLTPRLRAAGHVL